MILKKVSMWVEFLKHGIWKNAGCEVFSPLQQFLLRPLKIILLAIHKFDQKHSRLQAASMTYYSVLSLVPSLTVIFGLMKGFGLENTFKEQLYVNLPSHKDLLDAIFHMVQNYVTTTSGSVFAGVGLALLLWGIFKTLSTIEDAFNDIWGITESKSLRHKLSDYLTVFLFCPLLIILSGSLSVYAVSQTTFVSENFIYLRFFIKLLYASFIFLPFIVIWMVFTFVYMFMPNTKVSVKSALWGGIVAGCLYQVTQWAYILFQAWMARSNAIYGSLAALPLFLVWMQLSWMIMLFGAEVCFARQYLRTYEFEPDRIVPSPSLKKLVALLVMYACVKNFQLGQNPRTIQQMAEYLHIPCSLVQEVVDALVQSGLLSKVLIHDDKTLTFQPARTIEEIRISDVCDAIEYLGDDEIVIPDTPELKTIRNYLQQMKTQKQASITSLLLKDL